MLNGGSSEVPKNFNSSSLKSPNVNWLSFAVSHRFGSSLIIITAGRFEFLLPIDVFGQSFLDFLEVEENKVFVDFFFTSMAHDVETFGCSLIMVVVLESPLFEIYEQISSSMLSTSISITVSAIEFTNDDEEVNSPIDPVCHLIFFGALTLPWNIMSNNDDWETAGFLRLGIFMES
uniref:Uncharacterized protein n=1 Tax=Megaselia scalaris TaxID=36166 RepID=T1GAX6_MEGSC